MTTKQLERLKLALVLLLKKLRSKKRESILCEELTLETSSALTTHNTKTIATRSINGMSGNNNLPSKENTAEPIAAVSAPLAVTGFFTPGIVAIFLLGFTVEETQIKEA